MLVKNERDAPTDLESRVGRQVRKVRGAFGWSQAELGQRLSLNGSPMAQSTVAKIESGSRPLRLNELAQLADVFGLSIFELLEEVREDEVAQTQQELVWATDRLRRIDTALERAESEIEELKRQRVGAYFEVESIKTLIESLREKRDG